MEALLSKDRDQVRDTEEYQNGIIPSSMFSRMFWFIFDGEQSRCAIWIVSETGILYTF